MVTGPAAADRARRSSLPAYSLAWRLSDHRRNRRPGWPEAPSIPTPVPPRDQLVTEVL